MPREGWAWHRKGRVVTRAKSMSSLLGPGDPVLVTQREAPGSEEQFTWLTRGCAAVKRKLRGGCGNLCASLPASRTCLTLSKHLKYLLNELTTKDIPNVSSLILTRPSKWVYQTKVGCLVLGPLAGGDFNGMFFFSFLFFLY